LGKLASTLSLLAYTFHLKFFKEECSLIFSKIKINISLDVLSFNLFFLKLQKENEKQPKATTSHFYMVVIIIFKGAVISENHLYWLHSSNKFPK